MPVHPSYDQMNGSQALHWDPKELHPSVQLLCRLFHTISQGIGTIVQQKCSKQEGCSISFWSKLETDHDFAQFVAFGPDVVHEHLIGSELELNGQRVVLTLLHLLQLDSFAQVPHHLNPESSLTEEAKGSMGKG